MYETNFQNVNKATGEVSGTMYYLLGIF